MVTNAQALCKNLKDLGYKIVTDGTDNHIVLVDLRNIKLSGSKAERILEDVGISVNKNTVPGDKSAMNPSGMFICFFYILKSFQNKKGQNFSRCIVFGVFFSAASCKKRHRKQCTWDFFGPFLFSGGFSNCS